MASLDSFTESYPHVSPRSVRLFWVLKLIVWILLIRLGYLCGAVHIIFCKLWAKLSKHNISRHNDMMGLWIHNCLPLNFVIVADKYSFCWLCIKLPVLALWDMNLSTATKHFEVWNIGFLPCECFYSYLPPHGICRAIVHYVYLRCTCLSPTGMCQLLNLRHGPCTFHYMQILRSTTPLCCVV